MVRRILVLQKVEPCGHGQCDSQQVRAFQSSGLSEAEGGLRPGLVIVAEEK
jgi:hypothetical protein